MVKKKKILNIALICLTMLIIFLSPTSLTADQKSVYDQANLFSEAEVIDLEAKIKSIANVYDMDIIILSTLDTNNKTCQEYADDFYDDNDLGKGIDKSGILLLIDMDNRELHLSTSGAAIKYFTDQRQENILENITANGLGDKEYYKASIAFLNSSKDYLNKGIPSSRPAALSKPKKSLGLIDGAISLGSGAIASALFFFKTKSSYEMKNPIKQSNFKVNSKVNLLQKQDILLDTVTTNRVISKANKDDSDVTSTTHTAASGKTHGGSGKKF